MAWLGEHKGYFRLAGLVVLLIAFAGPWAYSMDGVPPAEYCSGNGLFLVTAERCAREVRGLEVFSYGGMVLFSIPGALLGGEVSLLDMGREILFLLLFLLLGLPLVSTLLAVWRGETQRLRALNLAFWGLASIPALRIVILAPLGELPLRFWGIWLYLGLAAFMLALDLLPLPPAGSPPLRDWGRTGGVR